MSGGASYGQAFSRRFGAETVPVFVNRTLRQSEIAVTYLRQELPTYELSEQQPVEDSYLVSLGWRDYPKYELWENGRPVNTSPVYGGQITIYDFKETPVIHCNNPLVGLHFYLPRAAFDALADNVEVPRMSGLKYTHNHGMDDAVMRGLSLALMPAFENPEQASRLFVELITMAAATHIAHTYGGLRRPMPKRGGLAPWQVKRAKEILDTHLNGDIQQSSLAQECGLSASHFARAFRVSTGMAPHQWLLSRRIEKAKAMLRDTDAALIAIASASGFADQSHFTRVFTRIVGVSPGAWRRAIRS
jgi:AraC-like DNA-binding protein